MRNSILLTASLLGVCAAQAGSKTWFTPLTESAPVTSPNSLEETASPWVTPEGIAQWNALSLREVEDTVLSPLQSIVRVDAGGSSSMIDMLAYDPTGSYLFLPHETPFGAGASRHSIADNFTEVIFQGDGKGATGDYSNDYGAFDPARFTPNGTLFLGEEWSGTGRIVEIMNPMAPAEEIEHRVLESIANVSHEGINFSKDGNMIYYVDEWNSGSIYRFVMKTKGDYTRGQTEVLSVNDFISSGGDPSANWNQQAEGVVREGEATWIPLTDENGVPLPGITDPFRDGPTNDPRENNDTRGGRPAADDAGATPFGRPEDMAVGRLANGRSVIYFTATSENKVYSIEMGHRRFKDRHFNKAIVRTFISSESPKNVGFEPTTGVLNSPDNLAIDALGNIYVIEDAPNGSSTGGDIWMVRDTDSDGVGESLDHFMSIRVDGSEATGMIWNPAIPTEFAVAVQHPDSTDLDNVPDGLGDAVWLFDISHIDNEKFLKNLNKARPIFGE
ncbi:alkaline phosphatase PhoX [Haloferula sp.]|uniref:alkaline phosphatase PhoX n=1 Tax=Haloferula sp. TaxID=2497595 RepID=UPI003C71AA0F